MLMLNFFLQNRIVDDLFVIHVDPGFGVETEKIKKFLEEKDIKYRIKYLDISKQLEEGENHPCFYCSLKRREFIFRISKKEGYRNIAFGHNRDDVVETFMMNILFHGEVSTLTPTQNFFRGKIRIIRPLYFLWEDWIEHFIDKMKLPTFRSGCPYQSTSKRDEIREFIESYPHSKANIYRSIYNVKKDYLPGDFQEE